MGLSKRFKVLLRFPRRVFPMMLRGKHYCDYRAILASIVVQTVSLTLDSIDN
jgi:hypothetical protein